MHAYRSACDIAPSASASLPSTRCSERVGPCFRETETPSFRKDMRITHDTVMECYIAGTQMRCLTPHPVTPTNKTTHMTTVFV